MRSIAIGVVRRARIAAGVLAATTVVAGCGGASPSVEAEPAAVVAVAEALTGPFRWEARIDADADLDELRAAAELYVAHTEVEPAAVEEVVTTAEELVDQYEHTLLQGAVADDGSLRFAATRDGSEWLDVRLDIGGLLFGGTATREGTLLVKADWPLLFEQFDRFGLPLSVDAALRQARNSVRSGLDGQIQATALALLDGEWAGVAGTLDLEAWSSVGSGPRSALGLQGEPARRFRALGDPTVLERLLAAALELDEFRVERGRTVATVDVRPRDAVRAIVEEFDLGDQDAPEGFQPEDIQRLPELIEGVGTVWFDPAGRFVELRADLLGIAQGVARELATNPSLDTDLGEIQALLQALNTIEDSRAHIAFSVSAHGEVDTVTDVAATTATWEQLSQTLFGLMIGLVSDHA